MLKKMFISSLAATFVVALAACAQTQKTLAPIALNGGVSSLSTKNTVNTMTVATYNVRNLFDGVQNPGKEAETAKPKKELEALARGIKNLNADVIAFVEVESKETLKNFFLDKYLPGNGYEVVLLEGNDGRGIDVAVATKFPVINVKSHKDLTFNVPELNKTMKFSRDLIQVEMKAGNYPFTMFVGHLKSKHGTALESDSMRKAEANQIKDILTKYQAANPKANFLLCGDFNDIPASAPLKPLLEPSAGLQLTDIILKDMGTADYVYTYHPKQYRSRIDYILVSPGMMNEYVSKSVQIMKTIEPAENDDIKFTYFTASDHLPSIAKFNIATDK